MNNELAIDNEYPLVDEDYTSCPGYIVSRKTGQKKKHMCGIGQNHTVCWKAKLGSSTHHVKKAEATYHKVDAWLAKRQQRLVDRMFEISECVRGKVTLYASHETDPDCLKKITLMTSADGIKGFTTEGVDNPSSDESEHVSATGEIVLGLQNKYWECSTMRGVFKDVLRMNICEYLHETRDVTRHTETLRMQINGRWYQVEWGVETGKVRITNIPEITV